MKILKKWYIATLVLILVIVGYQRPIKAQIIPIGKVVNTNKIRQSEKLQKISPGGNRYSSTERSALWQSIKQDHSLQTSKRNNESWELVGPQGIISSEGINFICSGRIRDVEILDDNHLRIASASGGLWDIRKGDDVTRKILG